MHVSTKFEVLMALDDSVGNFVMPTVRRTSESLVYQVVKEFWR